ncbi:hypothetical protein EPN83_00815 [Patescibacteria group bacterium]|nr:MAG: hypothetical protein EPN83_00815 [Patescibacteria group bacterium]
MTLEQLAKHFGKTVGWAWQHLSLLRLHPDVQKLMSPELPRSKQLRFSIAIMLVKWSVDEQTAIAARIVEGRWKLRRARHEIRKRAQQLGLETGGAKRPRQPHDDYRILASFLRRISEDAELLLGLKAKRFDEMFAARSQIERVRMLKSVEECIESLTLIRQHVERPAEAQRILSS